MGLLGLSTLERRGSGVDLLLHSGACLLLLHSGLLETGGIVTELDVPLQVPMGAVVREGIPQGRIDLDLPVFVRALGQAPGIQIGNLLMGELDVASHGRASRLGGLSVLGFEGEKRHMPANGLGRLLGLEWSLGHDSG